jgi:hypothetical protein
MLNSPVFIGLVGRLLGGSQHSLLRFLVRAWSRGMLAFSRATSSAINNQGAMRMLPFAFQPAPNWAVKRTPTLAMASPFSWPVSVPSAFGSGAAYLGR